MELGPMQNFVYLIGDASTGEAAVVDPAWDPQAILAAAKQHNLQIKTVLLTHTHFDHINGVEAILEATDARVFVHKKEAAMLQYGSNVKKIESGEAVRIGGLDMTFIHTPGHTPGSQCFYVGDRLIAGDTLFIRGCGRCDLPGGSPEEMYHSLTHQLGKLHDHTRLYPGHNYADVPVSTLGDERVHNPYLLAGSLEQFLRITGGGA
jgi:glyoxylase-like metal-dependent hydrolase (beta-lactamase superfamily II)